MFISIVMGFLILISQVASAAVVTVGSLTSVSQVSTVNFLEADTNSIIGFTWIKDELSLENANTECTYSSLGKVSGDIDLHDGTLTLTEDLRLHGDASFVSLGTIIGAGQTILFSSGLNSLPSGVLVLEDVSVYFFNDLTIDCSILIKGNCSLISSGADINFSSNAEIVLDDDATLTVKQVDMKGISGLNVRCSNAAATIKLFDSSMRLADDYVFDTGKFEFYDRVTFSGGYEFSYESDQTSLVTANSRLILEDDIDFRLGRFDDVTTVEPLEFIDHTSQLINDNSTLTSSQHGLNLLRGSIVCTGEVQFYREGLTSETGITLGDGADADNDFYIYLKGGSLIQMNQGYLVYNNVAPDGIKSLSRSARIIRKAGSSLLAQQNMVIPALSLDLEPDVLIPLQLATGKTITFLNTELNLPVATYNVVGTLTSPISYLLSGSNKIFLTKGTMPQNVVIQNGSNLIGGNGAISGKITLSDLYAWVIWSLNGFMKNDIELNGGTFIMQSDLTFTTGTIASSGTVQLGENILTFAPDQETFTENILFDGSKGTIKLSSDVTLNGTWTISNSITIDGDGHELRLGDSGEIIVIPGGCLHFKNIIFSEVTNNALRCLDDAAIIKITDSEIILTDDFVFDKGKIEVIGKGTFKGKYAFDFASSQSIRIESNSTFCLTGGVECKIGRFDSETTNEPFYFTDNTSRLILDNCNFFVKEYGTTMTRGIIVCSGIVDIHMDGDSAETGSIMGDGVSQENDFKIIFRGDTLVNLNNGYLTYNNVQDDAVKAFSKGARLVRKPGATMIINQDAMFPAMTLELEADEVPPLIIPEGKVITYQESEIVLPMSSYHISGEQVGSNSYILDGGDSISLTRGVMPLDLCIENGNNILNGNGAISGKLSLKDLYAWAVWQINGVMKNDVELNGGTLILQSDLKFTTGSITTGGTIQLAENTIIFAPDLEEISQNMVLNGTSGSIDLRSDITLNSTLTITGEVIIDGSEHSLVFGQNGEIIVAPDGCLHLKNITLQDLSQNCVRCLDNTGRIILDFASLYQKEDMSFALGSLSIFNSVKMNGMQKMFHYSSTQPLTINSEAKLKLNDKFVFDYSPSNGATDTFVLVDENAQLVFENACMHIGSQGIKLHNGLLQMYGKSEIRMSEGVFDGVVEIGSGTAQDDCTVILNPSATLSLFGQTFDYKNTSQDLIVMAGDISQIVIKTGAGLRLFNSLSLGNGFITFEDQTSLKFIQGTELIGSVLPLGAVTIEEFTV